MKINIIQLEYEHIGGEIETGKIGIISEDGIEFDIIHIEEYLYEGQYINPETFSSVDPENTPKYILCEELQDKPEETQFTKIKSIKPITPKNSKFNEIKEELDQKGLLVEYDDFIIEILEFADKYNLAY